MPPLLPQSMRRLGVDSSSTTSLPDLPTTANIFDKVEDEETGTRYVRREFSDDKFSIETWTRIWRDPTGPDQFSRFCRDLLYYVRAGQSNESEIQRFLELLDCEGDVCMRGNFLWALEPLIRVEREFGHEHTNKLMKTLVKEPVNELTKSLVKRVQKLYEKQWPELHDKDRNKDEPFVSKRALAKVRQTRAEYMFGPSGEANLKKQQLSLLDSAMDLEFLTDAQAAGEHKGAIKITTQNRYKMPTNLTVHPSVPHEPSSEALTASAGPAPMDAPRISTASPSTASASCMVPQVHTGTIAPPKQVIPTTPAPESLRVVPTVTVSIASPPTVASALPMVEDRPVTEPQSGASGLTGSGETSSATDPWVDEVNGSDDSPPKDLLTEVDEQSSSSGPTDMQALRQEVRKRNEKRRIEATIVFDSSWGSSSDDGRLTGGVLGSSKSSKSSSIVFSKKVVQKQHDEPAKDDAMRIFREACREQYGNGNVTTADGASQNENCLPKDIFDGLGRSCESYHTPPPLNSQSVAADFSALTAALRSQPQPPLPAPQRLDHPEHGTRRPAVKFRGDQAGTREIERKEVDLSAKKISPGTLSLSTQPTTSESLFADFSGVTATLKAREIAEKPGEEEKKQKEEAQPSVKDVTEHIPGAYVSSASGASRENVGDDSVPGSNSKAQVSSSPTPSGVSAKDKEDPRSDPKPVPAIGDAVRAKFQDPAMFMKQLPL